MTENRYLYSVKIEGGRESANGGTVKIAKNYKKRILLSNKLLRNTCSGLYTPKTIF